MRYGLYIHWSGPCYGNSGGICKPDGSPNYTDINVYADTFDIVKIADDIQALGFEYVIVTDFHGRGTMIHPSAISDEYRGTGYSTTERDVIGEFIDAVAERGIGTILFTHPLDGHDFSNENAEKLGWNDPTDKYKKWNDFINAMHAELSNKYGSKIMGFGFDSEFGQSNNPQWKGKLDLPRLRQTILSHNIHLQLYALAGPNETAEFGMKEIWRPSWLDPWKALHDSDYNVENWPAYKRMTGIVFGNHWCTIAAAKDGKARLKAHQLYRYSVLQAGTATEGPGVAWAASPYSTGEWEANVREVFAQVEEWSSGIRTSLRNVHASTSYPTIEGTKLSELPSGIVATKSIDDLMEYIHVLNPPDSKVLTLPKPEDGKIFLDARSLRTETEIMMTEVGEEIVFELAESDEWEYPTTVIALTVDPITIQPTNLALHKRVTYSGSLERVPKVSWPFGSIRVNNGVPYESPNNPEQSWTTGSCGWTTNPHSAKFPPDQWVAIHLSEEHNIGKIVLYPRNAKGMEGTGFPVRCTIEGSEDNVEWFPLAPTYTDDRPLGDASPHVIACNGASARHVRIVGHELRKDGENGGNGEMQFVEIQIFEPEANECSGIFPLANTEQF